NEATRAFRRTAAPLHRRELPPLPCAARRCSSTYDASFPRSVERGTGSSCWSRTPRSVSAFRYPRTLLSVLTRRTVKTLCGAAVGTIAVSLFTGCPTTPPPTASTPTGAPGRASTSPSPSTTRARAPRTRPPETRSAPRTTTPPTTATLRASTPIEIGPGPQSPYTVQTQPAPGSCNYRASGAYPLPDPRCTPGAINPLVTQANLATTICRHGYTASVRPPARVTDREKAASAAAYGYAGSLHTAEYDHLISLELGGDPNDPANLWVEPNDRAGATT